MLTRLRGLLAGRSLPGWIVLGWVVLGEIHEGKFALEVLDGITEFFQHHVFMGLLIGFSLLFLATAWSELSNRMPSWLRFRTIHERVHELEHSVNAHEAACTEVHDGFETRIKDSEKNHQRFMEWVTQARNFNSNTQDRLDKLQRLMASAFSKHVVRESELTELAIEIRSCTAEYMDLRALYPEHPAATKPFATSWRRSRPEEPADDATRHFERWAIHMEHYVRVYDAFSDKWNALRERPAFWGWVTNWLVNRHDRDALELISAMTTHLNVLVNTRQNYAADLERAIGIPRVTIS
jgi:hypothetical protein